MDSPSLATPRQLIKNVLASKTVSQSALKPTKKVKTPASVNEPVAKRTRSSPRKSAIESDTTPRTLIQGFLNVHQTEAPTTRKRSRLTQSPLATTSRPPSTRRRSTRMSAILNHMRQNQPQDEETPRTIIKNFLVNADEETPERQVLTETESTPSSELTSTDTERFQKLRNVLKPPTPGSMRKTSQRSSARERRNQTSLKSFAEGVDLIRASQGAEESVFEEEHSGFSGLESIAEDESEVDRDDMGAELHRSKDMVVDAEHSEAVAHVRTGTSHMDRIRPTEADSDVGGAVGNENYNDDADSGDDGDVVSVVGLEDVDVDINEEYAEPGAADDDDDDEEDGEEEEMVEDEGVADDSEDAEEQINIKMGTSSANTSRRSGASGSRASVGEDSVFVKSSRTPLVQETLDRFAVKPRTRPLSPSLVTPLLLKQAKQPTPQKLKAQKQSAKPPVHRKKPSESKEERQFRLPISLTKGIFQHYSRSRVSKAAMAEVEKMTDVFWKNLSEDLVSFCNHRHGAVTVDESDVELLMKRQRFITKNQSMYTLVEKHLPLEYRQEIIPMAKSGNKVVPKY